jgi:heme exporter protein C
MWKILYQFGSPKIFYNLTGKWIPVLQVLAALLLLIGATWGVLFAPSDYLQGDAFRIIYVHVPCAFLSMSLYGMMGFLALLLLIWRIKLAGIMLIKCAETGAIMTFLALATGSIWGKPMWGAWWVWDARLTSELILLLFYCAILAVQYSYKNQEQGAKITAILTIVGLIDLPIIHYSVAWWNTLHQGTTISAFAKPKIALSMAYPLFIMIAAFSVYCMLLIILKTRNEILIRERKQRWVSEVL